MLKIRNLRKIYGNYHALDGLDMDIEDGSLYGFVGPNGAGKTTTIKIISGLLLPDGGSVEIDGIDALAQPHCLKEKIGYVPDYFGVYDNLKVWVPSMLLSCLYYRNIKITLPHLISSPGSSFRFS